MLLIKFKFNKYVFISIVISFDTLTWFISTKLFLLENLEKCPSAVPNPENAGHTALDLDNLGLEYQPARDSERHCPPAHFHFRTTPLPTSPSIVAHYIRSIFYDLSKSRSGSGHNAFAGQGCFKVIVVPGHSHNRRRHSICICKLIL